MSSSSSPYSPSDDEVVSQAAAVRSVNPGIGTQKLLQAIKTENPTWTLSEKVLSP